MFPWMTYTEKYGSWTDDATRIRLISIWYSRVVMIAVLLSYSFVMLNFLRNKDTRSAKVTFLMFLAIFSTLVSLLITFTKSCQLKSRCYDMYILALFVGSLFHWAICFIYMKTATEMPFLFKISIYLEEPLEVNRLKT